MSGEKASRPDLLEPGTHVFSGTVRVWGSEYAELTMDSGVTIQLITQGHPVRRVGERVTIVARRYRPLYQVEKVGDA